MDHTFYFSIVILVICPVLLLSFNYFGHIARVTGSWEQGGASLRTTRPCLPFLLYCTLYSAKLTGRKRSSSWLSLVGSLYYFGNRCVGWRAVREDANDEGKTDSVPRLWLSRAAPRCPIFSWQTGANRGSVHGPERAAHQAARMDFRVSVYSRRPFAKVCAKLKRSTDNPMPTTQHARG